MSDDAKKDKQAEGTPEGAEGEAKKKLPIKLIGGAVGLIAAGAILAMVALPKKKEIPRLEGPFYTPLTAEPVPVSTVDNNNRRYVKFAVDAEYRAYVEAYVTNRANDPFYSSTLRSRIERAASNKTIKEITEGLNRDTFAEYLRDQLEAVVFPLHVGETANPLDKEPQTGLRPGISRELSTFRGHFWDHALHFDGTQRTIRIDEGPEVVFTGEEEDLRVETTQGEEVFLDVTHFNEEFVGDIQIGVMGHLRRLILHDTIAQ